MDLTKFEITVTFWSVHHREVLDILEALESAGVLEDVGDIKEIKTLKCKKCERELIEGEGMEFISKEYKLNFRFCSRDCFEQWYDYEFDKLIDSKELIDRDIEEVKT